MRREKPSRHQRVAAQAGAVPQWTGSRASEQRAPCWLLWFPLRISAGFGIFHLSVSGELLAEGPGNFCPHLHPWKPGHRELCNPPSTLQTGGLHLDLKYSLFVTG